MSPPRAALRPSWTRRHPSRCAAGGPRVASSEVTTWPPRAPWPSSSTRASRRVRRGPTATRCCTRSPTCASCRPAPTSSPPSSVAPRRPWSRSSSRRRPTPTPICCSAARSSAPADTPRPLVRSRWLRPWAATSAPRPTAPLALGERQCPSRHEVERGTVVRVWSAGAEAVADLGEQDDLLRGGLGLRLDAPLASLGQRVHRHDDHEVDRRGDDDEADERRDERAELDVSGLPVGEVRSAAELADDIHDDGDERGDDLAECGTDDDGDREVDDVPPHQEVLETLDHERSFLCPVRARPGASGPDRSVGPSPGVLPVPAERATCLRRRAQSDSCDEHPAFRAYCPGADPCRLATTRL